MVVSPGLAQSENCKIPEEREPASIGGYAEDADYAVITDLSAFGADCKENKGHTNNCGDFMIGDGFVVLTDGPEDVRMAKLAKAGLMEVDCLGTLKSAATTVRNGPAGCSFIGR